jgi:hypothetical protein
MSTTKRVSENLSKSPLAKGDFLQTAAVCQREKLELFKIIANGSELLLYLVV